MSQILIIAVGLVVTILSGFGESIGVTKSAQMWGKSWIPDIKILIYAFIGFLASITGYMLSVKLFKAAKLEAPEIHFNLWYLGAVIGIALLSRKFFLWPLDAKIISVLIICLVLWLSYRTGGA